ncbi:MAG: hypothetical protein EZS28_037243 [Streblomastix strix]|uniref:pH-response regulator protein palC n=1 Tax=Streblomastix strix TaxID=222440 RepID=A0A5J4UAK4_9EUKA|nr:MAG: hypothetical protein EZS28_037243 [Streblomastix strix]
MSFVLVKCIAFPNTIPINFASVLKNTSPSNLQLLTSARNEMSESLSGKYSDEQVTKQIEKYLPYLFGLQAAIKKGNVALNQPLIYQWSSFLTEGDHKYLHPQVAFEICMTLSAYSFALANTGVGKLRDLIKDREFNIAPAQQQSEQYLESAKQCLDLFRRATGVGMYVAELANTIDRTKGNLPIECTGDGMKIWAQICTAHEQLVLSFIAREKKASSNLIARILLGSSDLIHKASELIDKDLPTSGVAASGASGVNYNHFFPVLRNLLQIIEIHYKVISYKYFAMHIAETQTIKFGDAVAIIMEAAKMNDLCIEMNSKLRLSVEVSQALQLVGQDVTKLKNKYTEDNSNIYMVRVPELNEQVLEQPAIRSTPVPFQQPTPIFDEII